MRTGGNDMRIRFHEDIPDLTGETATAIMWKWGRLLGWSEARFLTPTEVKTIVARFALGFYRVHLPEGAATMSDADFLTALAHTGLIQVILE